MSAGSNRSGLSRASSSMGLDGGEAGRRMAMEDEYIRSELHDATSFCNSFWVSAFLFIFSFLDAYISFLFLILIMRSSGCQ